MSRIFLTVRFLFLFLILELVSNGAERAQAGASVAEKDMATLVSEMPDVDVALMLRFYGEYAPDLIEEWKGQCASHPLQSVDCLRRMAVHFRRLEDIRRSDPEEYARLLEYEGMQSRARLLGKEIRQLRKDGKAPSLEALSADERQRRLEKATSDLQAILEQSFDESMRQQAHEIDKLEAEVAELRKLLEIRRLNRQTTLKQRFSVLVGEP